MTHLQEFLIILMCAIGTVFTRFFPFAVFSRGKTPKYVTYLGKALPAAIFGMLVIYCLKDVSLQVSSEWIPAAIGIAVTVVLHLWQKKFILSIAGGTILYVILVNFVM